MKPIIVTSPDYFGHKWNLVAYGKSFYLGQDVKFCSRALGMSPRDIVAAIGSNDLTKPSVRRKLAAFIIDSLELDKETLLQLEPWALAVD
jgi:hypothetical protein